MLPRNHPDRIHIAFDDHRLDNDDDLGCVCAGWGRLHRRRREPGQRLLSRSGHPRRPCVWGFPLIPNPPKGWGMADGISDEGRGDRAMGC